MGSRKEDNLHRLLSFLKMYAINAVSRGTRIVCSSVGAAETLGGAFGHRPDVAMRHGIGKCESAGNFLDLFHVKPSLPVNTIHCFYRSAIVLSDKCCWDRTESMVKEPYCAVPRGTQPASMVFQQGCSSESICQSMASIGDLVCSTWNEIGPKGVSGLRDSCIRPVSI